jgi:hypothetical protein
VCYTEVVPGQPSGIMGVAVDGFPIYGPWDENGVELTPADLDVCNGMEVNGSYRYIITQDFPYGPGCLWGNPSDDIPDILCWKAKDYWYLMELTNMTMYSDCVEDPFAESTGTSGCASYFNNPRWFVDQGRGTMTNFNDRYVSSCSDPDNQYENSFAEDLTTDSDSELESLAGGAFIILASTALVHFILMFLKGAKPTVTVVEVEV